MYSEYAIRIPQDLDPTLFSSISKNFTSKGTEIDIRKSSVIPRETLYGKMDRNHKIDIPKMKYDFSLALYEDELYLCFPMSIPHEKDVLDTITDTLQQLKVDYSIEELT